MKTAAPAMIPGVVDGSVTASSDPDGTVSFHITIGEATDSGSYVELVVSGEHARRLGATLLAEGEHGTGAGVTEPVPCSVGVRLGNDHLM